MSQHFKDEINTVPRLQEHFEWWTMMVFRVEREAKVEDDEGEDLELYHGQVHAQTSPNSSTKWDVKLALDTPLANLYGLKSPAFGPQMSALRCRVAVGIQTLIPFPKADSGERHVCEDLPWGEGSRRVQVHGFIYHHRSLHTCIIQEKLKCIWIFNYSLKTWDSGALFTTKMVIQDATSFIFESMS